MRQKEVQIDINDDHLLTANLNLPENAKGLVIFADGSGSSRRSPRNSFVTDMLNKENIATLLADLLTIPENEVYENRFNIALLSRRLVTITEWALQQPELRLLPTGYFGIGTGAAAALQAAALLDDNIYAVVSRGGMPDLAGHTLQKVKTPTLLIIGSLDTQVLDLNKQAYKELICEKEMSIVDSASHLFEEPGTLHKVAHLAVNWYHRYLRLH